VTSQYEKPKETKEQRNRANQYLVGGGFPETRPKKPRRNQKKPQRNPKETPLTEQAVTTDPEEL